jgi:uncharacterized membrane-anchored protein
MNKKITVLMLLVILILVNVSIASKEQHLAHGQVVFLALRPIDPRSLMQGDYMALSFKCAQDIMEVLPKTDASKSWRPKTTASDGYAVVERDERQVGTFKNIFSQQELLPQELKLRFRVRGGSVKFATNAFFFQEGQAAVYQKAKFGQFRVNDEGELLLTALADQDLNILGEMNGE